MILKHSSNLPRGQTAPPFLGFGEGAPGHPGRPFGRGGGDSSQFAASKPGFLRDAENNLPCSAKLEGSPFSLVRPRPRESTHGPRRCAAHTPWAPPGTELWRRGASGSGFRLSNTDLQPRFEPPGAARSSGEQAPALRA